ncbi:hypothetical protein N7537_010613 [Penicillium hordei]|uniref:Zn(2)-C6 fungal-type domain-containing protein n=1 Tax=Penicillium hordei TaxID=40994 RepID=A0AAD6DWI1_9EURO|nr:uncharacterized protein N7537_010613 [Penicillium hordei]KAJ5593709.1 hypothetical protein N7537_010613 [Penicillium hordei]
MVTIRSPGGQTRRKFKESCSQCAFVKVKCGKEKPTCTRCQTRGLRCNYEVSHRAGRRPAAERVLSTDRISTSTRPTPVPQSPPAASSDKSVEFAAQFSASLPSDIDELCGLALPNIHSMSGTEISTGEGLSPYLLGVLPSERSFCDNATKSTRGQPDTLSSALVDPYKLWPGLGDIPNQFDSLGTSSSSSTSSLCNGALMGQNSCSQKMLAVLSGAQNDTHYKPWLLSPSSPGVDIAMGCNRNILEVATSALECPCLQTNHQLRYLLVFAAMDVLARHAAVAVSGPAGCEDKVARASVVFGELHRVLQFIDILFHQCRQRPSSSSSLTSPRRSPTPLQSLNFSDSIDPIVMASGQTSVAESPPEFDFDNNINQIQTETDVRMFDLVFLPLETEVRRQFETVRDVIKSILRNV